MFLVHLLAACHCKTIEFQSSQKTTNYWIPKLCSLSSEFCAACMWTPHVQTIRHMCTLAIPHALPVRHLMQTIRHMYTICKTPNADCKTPNADSKTHYHVQTIRHMYTSYTGQNCDCHNNLSIGCGSKSCRQATCSLFTNVQSLRI